LSAAYVHNCYSFFTAVSGASLYESWVYNGFNFILGLPIILFGVMDRDVSPEFALRWPQVYSTGRTNVLLNVGSILQWIGNAMLYAAVVCLMSYNVLFPTFYNMGLYVAGTVVMIGLVLALQAKVCFFHHQWSWPHFGAQVFSFCGMFLYYILIAITVDEYWGEAFMAYSLGITWLWGLFTVPLTAIFIDWVAYFTRFMFYPTQEMLFREFELQVPPAFFLLYLPTLTFVNTSFRAGQVRRPEPPDLSAEPGSGGWQEPHQKRRRWCRVRLYASCRHNAHR
jgi:magnesium-transporting ATPase (P-type)